MEIDPHVYREFFNLLVNILSPPPAHQIPKPTRDSLYMREMLLIM